MNNNLFCDKLSQICLDFGVFFSSHKIVPFRKVCLKVGKHPYFHSCVHVWVFV